MFETAQGGNQMLYEYFTKGTQETKTGAKIGMEIETDFLTKDGIPIGINVTKAILARVDLSPKLELGRQKIELSIDPQPTPALLFELAHDRLAKLYDVASMYKAYPVFAPDFIWKGGPLLYVQEERDKIWVALDGRKALEHLCRCTSIQFTVDVNPRDAIRFINDLWKSQIDSRDYAVNNARWHAYIRQSLAKYQPDRYSGPDKLDDLWDYADRLNRHRVVMHKGQPVVGDVKPEEIPDLDIDLFIRSVWWNYRLRRYGDTLALEMRPFARRTDESIPDVWNMIARVIGF